MKALDKKTVNKTKRVRQSTALSFEQKHTCRHCSYKSFTIVHMHEQTCDSNPNRDAYITKRYGPNHLTGSYLSKLSEARKLANLDNPAMTLTLSEVILKSVLLVVDFTVTPDLPQLTQCDLDSVFN
jgi:hypothetical protein